MSCDFTTSLGRADEGVHPDSQELGIWDRPRMIALDGRFVGDSFGIVVALLAELRMEGFRCQVCTPAKKFQQRVFSRRQGLRRTGWFASLQALGFDQKLGDRGIALGKGMNASLDLQPRLGGGVVE